MDEYLERGRIVTRKLRSIWGALPKV